MMDIIKDEKAQAGGIFIIFMALLLGGLFYVALGAMENKIQEADNSLITGGNIEYSQNHYDAMDLLYKYWWGIPIFIIIVIVIYGIKMALREVSGTV